ncbi:MAG: glycosyltransferase family 4 protein [Bacteroidales bacterium]|nr:glycosyltransferase family 4 protein [Bacteroidales bacterium]
MEVSIIHYHLNPGGVTRVIESQIAGIKSISPETNVQVLCGGANQPLVAHDVTALVEPLLGYSATTDQNEFSQNVNSIMDFFRFHRTGNPVFHFHNPTLGKNPAVTYSAYALASQGVPVVYHCHDFAEDRMNNLSLLNNTVPIYSGISLGKVMYPDFPNCHFVVLNSCDYTRILNTGIDASRVHLLPNPVVIQTAPYATYQAESRNMICKKLNISPTKKICTYPVRLIERKNPGEFILLAALFRDTAEFVVTLPPKNPQELPQYEFWKAFCNNNGLKVVFEAGEQVNHEELMNISDFCITTSIREGFGMAYLEPWLTGTPVIGRGLSCITADLTKQGVVFPRLYDHIFVKSAGEVVDFKDVQREEQAYIIQLAMQENPEREAMIGQNPFLTSFLSDVAENIIRENRQVISDSYSIEAYGKELLGIYRKVSR